MTDFNIVNTSARHIRLKQLMAYKSIEQLLTEFIYTMSSAKPDTNNTTPCDIYLLNC